MRGGEARGEREVVPVSVKSSSSTNSLEKTCLRSSSSTSSS